MLSGYGGILNQAQSVAIANGTTTTDVIPTGGFVPVGIELPAAFTGTTVTFTVASSATGTFQPLYNSAGAVSYTVAQGRYIAIDPKDFYGVAFFKIVSGSSEGAARAFTVALRGF